MITLQQLQTLWAEQNSKHLGANAMGETQTPNTVVSPQSRHDPITA